MIISQSWYPYGLHSMNRGGSSGNWRFTASLTPRANSLCSSTVPHTEQKAPASRKTRFASANTSGFGSKNIAPNGSVALRL